MALYSYEVSNKMGDIIAGRLNADREDLAIEQLRKKGLIVITLKEVKSSAFSSLFKRKKKVKIGDLGIFSRQLSTMIEAGIPITRSLYTMSKQTSNPTLKKILEEMSRNIEAGMSFADAISAYPDVFTTLHQAMIKSGEVGGNLGLNMSRLSEQILKEKNLKDSIRSASFYPIMLASFALLIMLGMFIFLVPVFVDFFPPEAVLPLPTMIVIGISDSLRGFWYIWLSTLAAIIVISKLYSKSTMGMRMWDRIKLKLPVFGSLIHKIVVARFARTFSTLQAGGIPVIQALETAGPTSGSILVTEAVERAIHRIEEGKNIAGPLNDSGMFPPMVTHMIALGEETGELPDLLTKIADFYEEEVATISKGLTSMLEPVMLIVVGVVVGLMLVSLYLPIFTVITQVGGSL